MSLLAIMIAAHLQVAYLAPDLPEGYPKFPERAQSSYPDDLMELKSLSDNGDGYATLKLGAVKVCDSSENVCSADRRALLQKAFDQGETIALALMRKSQLELDPTVAETIQPAKRVCGFTTSDLPPLSNWIESFAIPKYGEQPQPAEPWLIRKASGNLGSEATFFAAGPVSVRLIFKNDELKILRTTFGIDVGAVERWNAISNFNHQLAEKICPSWEGLGEAISHYMMKVADTWPPGGIHFEGDGSWLAATGVTPDIFWFDLYVDPFHNPYRSSFAEKFEISP